MSKKRENLSSKIAKQQRQRKKAEKRARKLARKQGGPGSNEKEWVT